MGLVRWRHVSLVFQGAMNSLDPVQRVDAQIAEAIRLHERDRLEAELRARIDELLTTVGITPALGRRYAHQLSGGQRQRVMIALALACRPSLVIADEPTTALDVVMQAQVLQLLERLREQLGLALILISHDLGVLAETCDRIAVMYAGRIVESGPVDSVFEAPQHPYTKRLLDTLPVIGGQRGLAAPIPGGPPDPGELPAGCRFRPRCPYAAERCGADPALREVAPAQSAACHFAPWTRVARGRGRQPIGGGCDERRPARWRVDDLQVQFRNRGTRRAGARRRLARLAPRRDPRRRRRVGLRQVDAGADAARPAAERPAARSRSTANAVDGRASRARAAPPRADDLPGPLPDAQPAPAGRDDRRRAAGRPGRRRRPSTRSGCGGRSTTSASTPTASCDRYPHQLSGGQRQRVAIAAALVLEPDGLICDEPVSMLDASVRTQILAVLVELQRRRGLALLFITHDLSLAWSLCDRLAVMYLGRDRRAGHRGRRDRAPAAPVHAGAGRRGPGARPRAAAGGASCSAASCPTRPTCRRGCRFHPRCPRRFEPCDSVDPPLMRAGGPGPARGLPAARSRARRQAAAMLSDWRLSAGAISPGPVGRLEPGRAQRDHRRARASGSATRRRRAGSAPASRWSRRRSLPGARRRRRSSTASASSRAGSRSTSAARCRRRSTSAARTPSATVVPGRGRWPPGAGPENVVIPVVGECDDGDMADSRTVDRRRRRRRARGARAARSPRAPSAPAPG